MMSSDQDTDVLPVRIQLVNEHADQLLTLNSLPVPQSARLLSRIVFLALVITSLILWFTPWVQTSSGWGNISTLDPHERTQPISALVSGRIQQWHVREGQQVQQGDPIVTLVDNDPELIARLSSQLDALRRQQAANLSALKTAKNDVRRRQTLVRQGLTSQRDLEQAQLSVQSWEAKIAKNEADINQAQSNLARQSIQTQYAPRDGTVVDLFPAGQSSYIKSGTQLATFIPHNVERAVMITVSGLDAPLILPGQSVRLQFEGWPMFHFSGWPSISTGAFNGVVEIIEPAAEATGDFRVWIKESPEFEPWPSDRYLRMGSRARGWIQLEEVRLGYEIWRQLNNFPPLLTDPSKQTLIKSSEKSDKNSVTQK